MKNKKIISVLFVLSVCLLLQQPAMAQKIEAQTSGGLDQNSEVIVIAEVSQLHAENTPALISTTLLGNSGEIVRDGDQRFLVTIGQPAIAIMKSTANDETGFWYIAIEGFSSETIETVTEDGAGEVSALTSALPEEFALNQNYPNPFNPSTTINFQIPEVLGSEDFSTTLKIYDIRGRLVNTLMDKNLAPGFYSVNWNGLNDNNQKVSSGVYFYKVTAGEFKETKKMLLVK